MRPELTALVVHDLKNALGALEAELLTLAQGQPGRGDPAEQASGAYRHCAELRQRFVMFLTAYGVTGRVSARATDESPTGLLSQLADATRATLGTCTGAPPFWYFDRNLVRLALQAAIHNAQRFARRQIVLDVRCEAGFLVLSVDDDGPGLGSSDPSAHSTGLGTELCAAVAAAHTNGRRCGRITLADRAEGGARFELWLP